MIFFFLAEMHTIQLFNKALYWYDKLFRILAHESRGENTWVIKDNTKKFPYLKTYFSYLSIFWNQDRSYNRYIYSKISFFFKILLFKMVHFRVGGILESRTCSIL